MPSLFLNRSSSRSRSGGGALESMSRLPRLEGSGTESCRSPMKLDAFLLSEGVIPRDAEAHGFWLAHVPADRVATAQGEVGNHQAGIEHVVEVRERVVARQQAPPGVQQHHHLLVAFVLVAARDQPAGALAGLPVDLPQAVAEAVVAQLVELGALAAAALQFPLAHPAIASVVASMATPQEVTANLQNCATPLPGAFWEELKDARLISQAALLRRLGLDEYLRQLDRAPVSALDHDANRRALLALLDPDGLGRVQALLQTRGLPDFDPFGVPPATMSAGASPGACAGRRRPGRPAATTGGIASGAGAALPWCSSAASSNVAANLRCALTTRFASISRTPSCRGRPTRATRTSALWASIA